MARSTVTARRRLGAALKVLRTDLGLKIEDAARELKCSTSKVSRLENGKGVPRHRDVRDLVTLYGAAAEERRDELMQLVDESLDESGGLTTDFSDILDGDLVNDDVRRFIALEQDAQAISAFQVDAVPGILQIADYTDALAQLAAPDRTPEQRERFVALRQERQEILKPPAKGRGKGLSLSLVVAEQALRRPVGGPEIMGKQLVSIADGLRNGLSHVEFRVAPTSLVVPAVFGGPFLVLEFADPMDQNVVYLEGRLSATYLETDAEVTRFKGLFAELVDACPDRTESISIVEAIAADLS